MESLLDYLAQFTDDPTTMRILIIAVAATAVGILGVGLSSLFLTATDPIKRRLQNVNDEAGVERAQRISLVTFNTLAGPVGRFVAPKIDMQTSETVRKLVLADLYSNHAVQNYYAIRAVLLVLLPSAVLFFSNLVPAWSTQQVMLFTACAAGFGYIAPSYVLDLLVDKRQTAMSKAFPDALDLMVVCIESGLGLAQTIERVAQELMVSHPELATEMSVVNAEMRAGVDSAIALKNFADRTGLDDIQGLVGTLVQTLRFGTSVADGLRIYSEEFRDKRTQAAEERAAKIGTKMLFPLVFFMFPAFFVVAVGPAVIQMINTFRGLN